MSPSFEFESLWIPESVCRRTTLLRDLSSVSLGRCTAIVDRCDLWGSKSFAVISILFLSLWNESTRPKSLLKGTDKPFLKENGIISCGDNGGRGLVKSETEKKQRLEKLTIKHKIKHGIQTTKCSL